MIITKDDLAWCGRILGGGVLVSKLPSRLSGMAQARTRSTVCCVLWQIDVWADGAAATFGISNPWSSIPTAWNALITIYTIITSASGHEWPLVWRSTASYRERYNTARRRFRLTQIRATQAIASYIWQVPDRRVGLALLSLAATPRSLGPHRTIPWVLAISLTERTQDACSKTDVNQACPLERNVYHKHSVSFILPFFTHPYCT